MPEKRLGMVVDTKRCIGCHTCAVACRIENNTPNNVWWNRVMTIGGSHIDTPSGVFPHVSMSHITLACQHCENPACTKVCPVGATYKRKEDGVVLQDYDKCIGCRMCIAACPYTGVRSFNWEEPQYYLDHALGNSDIQKHQKHAVEKCVLCSQRLARGEEPACIEPCPGRARHFGDFNDPDSKVSQLIRDLANEQLLPERGTNPSVYYLV
ncbi:4Fe-4S ferredoxin [Actinomycetota bacterium]|nr:4Fe-4S ferredoxin [Actinomycetota bacterium]